MLILYCRCSWHARHGGREEARVGQSERERTPHRAIPIRDSIREADKEMSHSTSDSSSSEEEGDSDQFAGPVQAPPMPQLGDAPGTFGAEPAPAGMPRRLKAGRQPGRAGSMGTLAGLRSTSALAGAGWQAVMIKSVAAVKTIIMIRPRLKDQQPLRQRVFA